MQLRSSRRASPSSLPHLPRAPPRLNLSRAPGLPPLAPRSATSLRRRRPRRPPTSHPLPERAQGAARPPKGRWRRRRPGPLLTSGPLSPCPGCPWPRPALPRPPHLALQDGLGGARRIAATAVAAARGAPPPRPPTCRARSRRARPRRTRRHKVSGSAPSRPPARAHSRPHQPPDTR